MSTIKHKEYEGTVEHDLDRGVLHGKILFINSLVTYEAETIPQLKKEFAEAVDDYLETCRQMGWPAEKPLKGQFNVRISPELHKAAVVRSVADGLSLNMVVVRALETHLAPSSKSVVLNLNVHQSADALRSMAASPSATTSWLSIGGMHVQH